MDPGIYQKSSMRTQCSQSEALNRIVNTPVIGVLHALIGMMGEIGELASTIERNIWYGQPLDSDNMKEELGDLQWYVAEMMEEMRFDFNEILEANINKLKSRYPEKFTNELAKEENRNRCKEADAINESRFTN